MDYLPSRILLQKSCSYKCQFCTKVYAPSKLVSQVHMRTGQNIKKKYVMCQILIKMLKQQAIPNSSLHKLKTYSSKSCRKTRYLKKNYMYVGTYLANIAILFEFSAGDITLNFGFLLRLVNAFTIDTDEYYPMCHRANMMPRPLKALTLY